MASTHSCDFSFPICPSNDTSNTIIAVSWNREQELDFFCNLRSQLKELGYELLILGYGKPTKVVDVPQLLSFYGLDSLDVIHTLLEQSTGRSHVAVPDFDEDLLLERERLWHGSEISELQMQKRRESLHFYRNFYTALLQIVKPRLVLLWNGEHTQETIFNQLCNQASCPVLYLERGPFRDSLQMSPDGCTASTEIARAYNWVFPDFVDKAVSRLSAEIVEEKYKTSQITWYSREQPKSTPLRQLKKNLGIPKDKKILLFTGQLDNDTSNFKHSPNFEGNLEAFRWFCNALRHRDDIFILGKHHPLDQNSFKEFQHAVEGLGIWVDNVSLENCLELADRVAAVNSTVLFEAIVLNKPILAMGKLLLSNKGIAYEIVDTLDSEQIISNWLAAKEFSEKRKRWLDFSAYLIAAELYFMSDFYALPACRGSQTMADDIVRYIQAKSYVATYHELRLDPLFVFNLMSFQSLSYIQQLRLSEQPVRLSNPFRSVYIKAYSSLCRLIKMFYRAVSSKLEMP